MHICVHKYLSTHIVWYTKNDPEKKAEIYNERMTGTTMPSYCKLLGEEVLFQGTSRGLF